mmetsp:Transcript_31050/g.72842  ORF Transcript_31050/g.72842 Transcript_31050/m.72842 type:complete len:230 (+) Transcript_31050:51-740(+)
MAALRGETRSNRPVRNHLSRCAMFWSQAPFTATAYTKLVSLPSLPNGLSARSHAGHQELHKLHLVLFHGPGIVDPSRCCTIWATTVLHLHDIATDSELKVHDMAAEFHRITTHFFEDRSLDAQCSRQQIRQLDLWLLLRAWVPRAHQLPMSLLLKHDLSLMFSSLLREVLGTATMTVQCQNHLSGAVRQENLKHLDVPLDGGKMQRGPLLRCALSDICFGIEQCRAALG